MPWKLAFNIINAHEPGSINSRAIKKIEKGRKTLIQTSWEFVFVVFSEANMHIETKSFCVDHGGDMKRE